MSDPDDPRSWIVKAESDLLNIENNLRADRVPWDTVCFHAQQAAEKGLKATLAANGRPIERTHDLEALLNACVEVAPSIESVRTDIQLLNPYSVSSRYPGSGPDPTPEQGRAAAAAAGRVLVRMRDILATGP